MKQCVTCNQWKDEGEFNRRYKSLGIRHPTCRECHKPFRKNWYENHKERHLKQVKNRKHEARNIAREYVFNYLSTHPCMECGEIDPRVLEFHHRMERTWL
jgi:hypothetical protein